MFRRTFRQSSEHQMTKTGFDNRFTDTRIGFVVAARHAAVLAEPAKAALDDPAPGQYYEAFGTRRGAHHLQPQPQRGGSGSHQRSLVAGVGPKQFQLRGFGLGFGQHGGGPDGVLDAGRLHQHGQGQALRIDDYRALTASYLLARIVAVAAPLLLPVRTDCESMAPAVVSGSRVSWRTCWRSPVSRRSQVPSSRQASNCLYTVCQGGRSCGSKGQAPPARNW